MSLAHTLSPRPNGMFMPKLVSGCSFAVLKGVFAYTNNSAVDIMGSICLDVKTKKNYQQQQADTQRVMRWGAEDLFLRYVSNNIGPTDNTMTLNVHRMKKTPLHSTCVFLCQISESKARKQKSLSKIILIRHRMCTRILATGTLRLDQPRILMCVCKESQMLGTIFVHLKIQSQVQWCSRRVSYNCDKNTHTHTQIYIRLHVVVGIWYSY